MIEDVVITKRNRSNSDASYFRSNSPSTDDSSVELSKSSSDLSRSLTRHSPVVSAMLRANLMKDCHQVRDMYFECIADESNSSASICKTAKSYFIECHRGGRGGKV